MVVKYFGCDDAKNAKLRKERGIGLPYQTLIASVLHKYAAGRLKEI